MVRGNGGKSPGRLEALLSCGFESFQLHWWAESGNENLKDTAERVTETLEGTGISISALALYGNPLKNDSEGKAARDSIIQLIRNAREFGCSLVGLFTGRLPGVPWGDSLPAFRKTFGEFCRTAADSGVRLAMENCPMGGTMESGDWNLAFGPREWTRLYENLPIEADKVLGLEWEPAHQIMLGNDVLSGFTDWSGRIFHVHGKDAANVENGTWIQTLPGRGQTAWNTVLETLGDAGYQGSIDIEGYHDPEWNGNTEIPGQVRSMKYLKACRDGDITGPDWL